MADFKTLSESLLLPLSQRHTLPQSLIYFVTSRCNAACDFCLYSEQLNNTDKEHIELTAAEVQQVALAYGKLHYLGISGGEPFIRKDLKELCQAFVDNCNVRVIDIPSNFYYGERMMTFAHDFLSKNKNVTLDLQLSLDNLREKHDASRKVKGLFEKAIQHFRALYALKKKYPNLMLKVNLVFLPDNKNELRSIMAELKTLISFDRLQITYPHFLLNSETENRAAQLEELNVFFELAREADRAGGSATQHDLYALGLRSVKKLYRNLLQAAVSGERNTGSYCEAGRHIAVMTEAGDIFPCEILWNEKIGNVRDYSYSIRNVLEADAYQQFRDKYLGKKNNCNCTWSCALNTEVSVRYKYFPALAANALSLLLNKQ